MVTVLVDNGAYAGLNKGDNAMLAVAIDRAFKSQWNVFAIVDSSRAFEACYHEPTLVSAHGKRVWLERRNLIGSIGKLIPKECKELSESCEHFGRIHGGHMSERIIRHRRGRRQLVNDAFDAFCAYRDQCDVLIVSGGGFMTDVFSSQAHSVLALAEWFIARRRPVAFFGLGLGPVENGQLRRRMGCVLRRSTFIGLREGIEGPKILKDLKVPRERYEVTGDEAICLISEMKTESEVTDTRAIGVNIRQAEYSATSAALSQSIIDVISAFAVSASAPLVSIPISWNPPVSDVKALSQLVEIDNKKKIPYTLHGVINEVATCRVVVTGSYHAAVFALAQGVPVVALAFSKYYYDKFAGLALQFKHNGIFVTNDSLNVSKWIRKYYYEMGDISIRLKKEARKQNDLCTQVWNRFSSMI